MKSRTIICITLSAAVAVVVMCFLCCLCRRRRRRVIDAQPTAVTNIYTVPTNYNAVMPHSSAPPGNSFNNRISSQGDRFAVPLDLLPPSFNYNAPGVEHKGNYVLIKDLKMLDVPDKDEYQKQLAYNPSFT